MPGDGGRAGHLIDGDKRHAGLRTALDRDDRDVLGELKHGVCGLRPGRDDEDSLDTLDAQPLERLEHGRPVERLEAHGRDEVPGLVCGAVDAEERRRRPVERRVQPDDPERPRPSGRERARHRVRAVVEQAHRLEDRLAGVRSDLGAAVDDAGHGLV